MALIHCDPFAHYTTAQHTDVYNDGPFGANVTIGAFGRPGRPGMRFSGDYSDSLDRQSLSTSGAVCVIQGDFRISAPAPIVNVIFCPLLGGNVQCSVDLNTDRTLAVFRGYSGSKTQLGSNSAYIVPLDTPIHLGAKFTIGDGTSGSIVVHVWEDGDVAARVVLNVTGVDTKDGATATWDGFDFGACNNGTTDWSNLIVMDGSGSAANDLLGPADVWALFASSREASALTDWSLSTGADAAALVDDASADDDTTYLEETTQNGQMTVAVDPVPYPSRTILGAQLYASVKLTSGSPSLRGIGYESATANLGVTFAPTSAYKYLMGPYSAMPSGATFSTGSAFDALQWGLKLTTTTTGARVTQIVVALIQERQVGTRNLLTGFEHDVTGDDNFVAGRENVVIGSNSQAHGTGATVIGDRSVLINLDGVPRTLTGNGKFEVYGAVGGDLSASAGSSATYLTDDDETGALPNSRQLLAGSGVTFDDSTPGERTLSVSASAVVKIDEQTPTGTNVTFSSLGSYTHLEIVWSGRGDQSAASTNLLLTFNGDTGSNYDRQLLQSAATVTTSAESIGSTSAAIGSVAAATATSGLAGAGSLKIFDYRGTAFQKAGVSNDTLRTGTGGGATFTRQFGIGWRNAAAITSITITLASGNFVAGSKFSLYGIA